MLHLHKKFCQYIIGKNCTRKLLKLVRLGKLFSITVDRSVDLMRICVIQTHIQCLRAFICELVYDCVYMCLCYIPTCIQ